MLHSSISAQRRGAVFCIVLSAAFILILGSCSAGRGKTAVLWTDRPEFALYTEYFNSSQDQYKVETRYFESPAQRLIGAGVYPDIVVGSWLKSASTRAFFKPLDGFLKNRSITSNAFYPRLLALGKIEGRQYLLPVSFNIPALVFARDKQDLLSNPFTIGFDEIKTLGKAFNAENNGVYTRMGFSPAWNDDFLFITAALFNTSFREADPLAWDQAALERAMTFVYDWTTGVNTSVQAEEDFTFKYFYEPPEKLALSGRILFAYLDSSALFTLAEDQRSSLDFRWVAEKSAIPLIGGSVYYGIPKQGKAKKAAAAFTRWFFQADTQRLLLEKSREIRLIETSFGLAGGFSALRPVTEQIFPQFYPSLLGRMPPENFLFPPNILPWNWTAIKERVILPYLHERVRHVSRDEIRPLERRISEWHRLNRD
ncbi:MAG: extracellular solute-binding protein [Treponema sp.]|jgi:ABC-type glycerol-3-phosphate transport system substrate-binding protein|nr:extracellular solute-binding protein [Treponema sp.]